MGWFWWNPKKARREKSGRKGVVACDGIPNPPTPAAMSFLDDSRVRGLGSRWRRPSQHQSKLPHPRLCLLGTPEQERRMQASPAPPVGDSSMPAPHPTKKVKAPELLLLYYYCSLGWGQGWAGGVGRERGCRQRRRARRKAGWLSASSQCPPSLAPGPDWPRG